MKILLEMITYKIWLELIRKEKLHKLLISIYFKNKAFNNALNVNKIHPNVMSNQGLCKWITHELLVSDFIIICKIGNECFLIIF